MASAGQGEQQLREVFARLDGHLTNRRFRKALKVADEGLALSPQDEDLLSCKAGLLLELERFQEAAALIEGSILQERLAFQLAYARYRSHDLEGALRAVERASAPGARELEAQVRFRLGQYAAAVRLYEAELAGQRRATPELATNAVAAYVCVGRGAEVPALLRRLSTTPADGFELAFNAACALLSAGDVPAAREMLALARRTGEHMLADEGLDEAERTGELAPVDAQLAVAEHLAGAGAKAAAAVEDAYEAALEAARGAGDAATQAVVAHNLAALAALTLERAEGELRVKPDLARRLGPGATAAILAGLAAAAAAARQRELADAALALAQAAGATTDSLALVRAGALLATGKADEAEAALGGARGASADAARAQIAAVTGDRARAASLLRALPAELAFRPGTVATVVALETGARAPASKDAAESRAFLEDALRHWERSGDDAAAASLGWALERLARLAEAEGDLPAAAAAWARLEGAAPARWAGSEELQRRGAWAAALVGAEPGPALAALAARLPRLDRAQEDALAGAGLAAGALAPPTTAAALAARESGAAAEPAADAPELTAVQQRKRRSRKRKVRYPKGYDPANPGPPPNPQRWLPKWQRSDGKKLRKKGRRDKVGGGRGGLSPMPVETSRPAPPSRQGPRRKGKGGRR
ncbi:hypothetical protein QBZ16_002314 [Prototheca wickerhamii]|uniref:Signal recognition particle subunit SRP72 n=1 Tax=Prototheca wickerhamii TaxID=3111 RepID=A0AAD9MIB9_PROWI|nr:hypothetical protein QBZ16_002314 [Prototheca wickerhamii]